MSLRKPIRRMPSLHLTMALALATTLALAGCGRNSSAPTGEHSVTLTWNASKSKVLAYHVYRSPDPATPPGLIAVTPPDVIKYQDQTVASGRTYYYSVKSVGLDGNESDPATITATVPAN